MRALKANRAHSCSGRFNGAKATAVRIAVADLIHSRVRPLLG
jgi:hypothetical protein